jgi:hypothetical protein
VALAAGCAAAPEKEREGGNPSGQASSTVATSCQELLGPALFHSVLVAVGRQKSEERTSEAPFQAAVSAVVRSAEQWRPGEYVSFTEAGEPCTVVWPDAAGKMQVSVNWSRHSLDDLRAANTGESYRDVGGDFYVLAQDGDGGETTELLLPCRVKGAHAGQASELPLQVRVRFRHVPGVDADLREEVVTQATRRVATQIPCLNRPSIPDSVL